jgi:glycosyltransferase involved in cell wall biosynthesis
MDHDLEEIVRFEDRYIPDEEVGLFFSAADLFVAPYIQGTQSGALTIAKSFNLPIVVTSALYEDGDKWNQSIVNVVPPGDAEALANGILKTLQEKKPGNARTANHSDESSEWGELVTIISSFISR